MEKRYDEREVRLILQRALESDAAAVDPTFGEPGLSLEQLKQIGTEVGIDTTRIELAAATLEDPDRASPNPVVGIATTVQFETVVPALEVSDIPRHELVDAIRSSMGRHGIVGDASDSITWQARDVSGGRYVSVTPGDDGVRLRVLGNYRDGWLVLTAAALTASLGASSVLLAGLGLGKAASLVLATVAGLVGARLGYRGWRRREDRRMAAVHRRVLSVLHAWAGRAQGGKLIPGAPSLMTAGGEPAEDVAVGFPPEAVRP